MIRPIVMVLAGAVALAACGSQERVAEEAIQNSAENVVTPPLAPTLPEPTVNAAASAEAAAEDGAIPAAFVGRWGMGRNDCDPARDDAKGLMAVEPRRLGFYEARATVKGVAVETADRVALDLAFSGEGQEWTTRTSFVLEGDGTRLVRTDKGWENGTFRYSRCPA